MTNNSSNETRDYVRKQYGDLAKGVFRKLKESKLLPCCGDPSQIQEQLSKMMGYSEKDLDSVPNEANMGLGCGNPKLFAALKTGETILDLGSGGGFDCFLAAKEVGPSGKVIGVDMTPEMVSNARKNASTTKATNVKFRLGEIEHLPVADNSVDVIISNCVINLSPEKPKVSREMFRVLKPGGRLAISDIVALKPLPEKIKKNLDMVSGCVGSTEPVEHIKHLLKEAGFQHIRIKPSEDSRMFIKAWFPEQQLEEYVASATIEAVKPHLQLS